MKKPLGDEKKMKKAPIISLHTLERKIKKHDTYPREVVDRGSLRYLTSIRPNNYYAVGTVKDSPT